MTANSGWLDEACFEWDRSGLRVLDGPGVLAVLTPDAVIRALKDAFLGLNDATSVQPPQLVMPLHKEMGDTIIYSGLIGEAESAGVTVSPYLTSLELAGKNPVSSFTLLLSTRTGLPVLLCQSEELVGIRTGATTSLAIDALAPKDDELRLGIFGAGPIARWHARFAMHVRAWSSVRCFTPTIMADEAAAKRAAFTRACPQVEFVTSREEALEAADVILLCTSSAEPVLRSKEVKTGALITSITTNAPEAREVAPEDLSEMDVFCDYRFTTPAVAGEMVAATRAGTWSSESILADLPELLSGGDRTTRSSRTRFFRSVGLGIEDVAVASLLVSDTDGGV